MRERVCTSKERRSAHVRSSQTRRQPFNGSFSRTFQVEATANKWLKVQAKYVSSLSLPPSEPTGKRREWGRDRVVSHGGQRGEDYSRYTPDKSVSSIICCDPSCGWRRPHILGEKRASTSLVCNNEDETKGRTPVMHSVRCTL